MVEQQSMADGQRSLLAASEDTYRRARLGLLRQPRRIVRRYLLLAIAWLATTDLLLASVLPLTHGQRWLFTVAKGALFVLVSAGLIWHLLRRSLSDYLRQERLARTARQDYARLFASLPVPALLVHDTDLRILDANTAAASALGYPCEALIGRHFEQLAEDGNALVPLHAGHSTILLLRRADGAELPMQWSATTVDGASTPRRLLVGVEMTAQSHADALHRMLTATDTPTGLPNRAWLSTRIDEHIRTVRAQRFAVLLLDLDHFRSVNEVHGHAQGDRLLRAVATHLRNLLDEHTLLARFSGDEFVLLASTASSGEQALAVAEYAMAAVATACGQMDAIAAPSGCSVGIALYPDHGGDADSLLSAADLALGLAKRGGRGRAQVFDPPMRLRETRHAELGTHLRDALRTDGDGLYLRYQPQYSLHDGSLTGMEALVRWRGRRDGDVPVAELIEVAERNNLMDALGSWVLSEAAAQLARWRAQGLYAGPLAVNVSPNQLRSDAFVELARAQMRDHHLPAGALELEITETVAMHVGDGVRRRINALANSGVAVVIDDFGTGYSSLAHFKRLQVCKLKIDVLFVRNVHQARDSQAIVQAMLDMARALGLKTVAEGVEQRAEERWLREHDCDAVQGFLYAPPLREDELRQHLASRRMAATGRADAPAHERES